MVASKLRLQLGLSASATVMLEEVAVVLWKAAIKYPSPVTVMLMGAPTEIFHRGH